MWLTLLEIEGHDKGPEDTHVSVFWDANRPCHFKALARGKGTTEESYQETPVTLHDNEIIRANKDPGL